MKKLLLIVSLLIFVVSVKAQYPITQNLGNDSTKIDGKGAIQSRFVNKVYTDTTQANTQRISQYPGAQIYTTLDSAFWLRNPSATAWRSVGGASPSSQVANGITLSGDTTILGDSLDRATFIYVQSRLENYARFNGLQLTNDSTPQDPYPYFLTYNPTPFGIKRVYRTSLGDIDSAFYGGNISTLFQLFRDSTDPYFGAGKRNELLPGMGGEFVGQYYPPRDTMVLKVGRDGQSGNVLYGQLDFGNSWGYNMNLIPESTLPGFPISAGRTSIDLNRVIDNTRRKKIVGSGLSGFTTGYKSYQNTINMSTYEAGNYTDSIFGLRAYGDMYPLISGATKAKTLAVWTVKNSFGLYVDPQYRYTNTVDNGYSLFAAGDSDFLYNRGFTHLGGTAPQRTTFADTRYMLDVAGKGHFSDSLVVDDGKVLMGGQVRGQVVYVAIDPSISTQPALEFYRSDSMTKQQAVIFAETAGTALTGRYLALRIGGNYTEAQNPSTSTGQYIRFETGPSQANVSRINRNGNWTIGNSVAVRNYFLYKKMAIDGNLVVLDSVQVPNVKTAPADSTTYKLAAWDAAGNLYKIPWAYAGGSSSLPVNEIAFGTGSGITSTINFTYSSATFYARATNDINFEVPSVGSDYMGMQLTTTKGYFYGSVGNIFEMNDATGALKANKYGVNTFAGTATYLLGVDASGNVVETSASGGGITIGTTTITSGTTTRVLYNNAGVVGEYTVSGSGNVAMTTSPTFTTPNIGTPSAGTLTSTTGYLWNNLANATGTQTLAWDDAELNAWTNGSNTEIFTTIDNNSLTTGTSFKWNSSSLTTGNLLSINSTSTALASGNEGVDINISGANATNAIIATGLRISVTNTNATSGTNTAADFTASGATTANIGLRANPNVVINTPTLDASNAIIVQGRTNGNYEGIAMYRLDNVTATFYGTAGITRAGAYTVKTTSGALTLTSATGVFIGAEFGSPTAWLHIKAGTATASQAPLKFTTGPVNTTAEAGALEYTTPQLFFTNGAAIRQELFQGQQSRVSTQFDKTDVTLANITGLTANVAAGKTYRFEAILYTTSNVAGGVKVAIAGTATATNIVYEGLTSDAGVVAQSRGAALATAVGAVTAVTAAYIKITGTITVNAAGTLTCQFAENAATATSSVLVGSTFVVIEML